MKLLLCFTLLVVPFMVVAQNAIADPECDGVTDFEECVPPPPPRPCNKNSKCFCKDNVAFCRCNNHVNEWYIGKDCSQKWTVVTFALVASLPGLALAMLVGVIVQCVYSKKRGDLKKGKKKPKESREDDNEMFQNVVFASEMSGRPNAQPPPQSVRPPMAGIPNRPYNQPNGMPPFPERPSMGGPPIKPYSYGAGLGQVHSNPHTLAPPGRNPYGDRSPSPDRYGDYRRPTQPAQNGMRASVHGYSQSPPLAPSYSAPDYRPQAQMGQFPRAQMGQQY